MRAKTWIGGHLLFWLIIAFTVVSDQLAKYAVRSRIALGETVPLGDLWISLTHYENSGAARSSFQGYARLFGIIGVIIVAAVLYARYKGYFRGKRLDIGLAFFVGGASGNAIDRLMWGKVTDFLVFRSGHGVLNLADLFINAGVLFILLDTVISYAYSALAAVRPDRWKSK
ncbi:signal peptidase II [Paenibacillus hamazuiensis]|uniref:signal peptidase II n=1 Tax=Paenibacillus hamazuiensis TaxID=2936508 RepID=UPI00200C7D18|nr:signal peptidase II [Paenibacillus hamazuiensis]